uniref:NIPA-like protein 3 n=1 Tax=Sinocyclocheilus grahami TaxID=75366 RepID=A0A672P1T4_SINGR
MHTKCCKLLSCPWVTRQSLIFVIYTQENLIGTLLAIFGNLLVSISVSIQKQSHVTLAGNKDPRQYYYTKTWWSGLMLMVLGEGALFVSYAFAPLSLIAPLNAVSVISSSILGFLFLREKWKAQEFLKRYILTFLGCALTAGGTYLFVTFGPNSHEKLNAENIVKHVIVIVCFQILNGKYRTKFILQRISYWLKLLYSQAFLYKSACLCAICFLGVFLITKTKRKAKAFEPYVTMDMAKGIPTIHNKGWAVQPDYNGSFSYGALENNDSVAPVTLPVDQELSVSPSPVSPYQPSELKKD